MSELGATFERDVLGNGRVRLTQYLRQIAFRKNGTLTRIASAFANGDANFPQVLDDAPFFSRIASNGDWRVHPTRDEDVWFSIGAPFVNPANPTRVSLNPFTRSGQVLTSVNPNFDARVIHAGHSLKLELQLKNGFVPPGGRVAFPLGAQGVTRVGRELRVGSVPVMHLDNPVVYDAANPLDVRPIDVVFQRVSGTLYAIYTLPDMAGMSAPVIDPTLSLQPDGTAGIDTYLDSVVTANHGAETTIFVGAFSASRFARTLIKFDLSALPTNALLSSVVFSIFQTADFSSNARTFRVYRQKRAWTELGATHTSYDGSNNWQTAGGFGANDCEQTDIGSRAFTATEGAAFKDFTLTPTTKAALDLGNGWMVKADTEDTDAYQFASSDNATAANRPQLVIEYTEAVAAQPGLIRVAGRWI